ncbi:MAG TPA: hypothetical protein VNC50_03105 [Planctomycetia bacterium]|nr:hypothetical protein [Planctomycetia bacterium]
MTSLSPECLFAAGVGDWLQALIPIAFFVVWIISAIARGLGQAADQQQAPRPNQPGPRPQLAARNATPEELADFLRQFGGQPQSQTPPEPRSAQEPSRRERKRERKQEPKTVAERRLRSDLEQRHGTVVHSRLEGDHLHSHAVREELTVQDAGASRPMVAARVRSALPVVGSLSKQQLVRAFVLGQVLRRPGASIGDMADPLGLPPRASN